MYIYVCHTRVLGLQASYHSLTIYNYVKNRNTASVFLYSFYMLVSIYAVNSFQGNKVASDCMHVYIYLINNQLTFKGT